MPAMPSANTIGIESSTSTAKIMATVVSSMDGPASVLGLALRQRGDHHGKAVDDNQDAADHRGCVEPGKVDLQPRRRQRAVEHAKLEAIPCGKSAHARDQ